MVRLEEVHVHLHFPSVRSQQLVVVDVGVVSFVCKARGIQPEPVPFNGFFHVSSRADDFFFHSGRVGYGNGHVRFPARNREMVEDGHRHRLRVFRAQRVGFVVRFKDALGFVKRDVQGETVY